MPVALAPITLQSVGVGPDTGVGGTTSPRSTDRATNAVFAAKLAGEATRQVEARRTPLTAATARQAIAEAYQEATGENLSESARDILTAHWAHETGHGASMYNYNFGGIKGTGPSGLSVSQRTREGYGATERQITDRFRAYTGIGEGAKDYVQLLISRYGAAVQAAKHGDASGFVRGLKDKGYFTGDPAAYTRSIVSIASRLSGTSSSRHLESSIAVGSLSAPRVLAGAQPNSVSNAPTDGQFAIRSPVDPRSVLAPRALLELSSTSGGHPSGIGIDSISQLSALRALEMQDEITRAALRIALDEGEEPGSGETGRL